MALEPGRTLAHYRLAAPIGQGGMGVVWRATDSSLGREAAIKVLPDALAADPERLARFEREAKLLAALNHPHVASIYGFHAEGPVRFLAMELVEGEDLAQRIARGAIPVAEALPLLLQVAQALEHAHEKGVIHRDLKPANVKLTAGGQAKVLDFGLAKALEGDPTRSGSSDSAMSVSPTITGHLTSANVLLGTAAYMAPEQARGQAVDRRADIWSFGVLAYEMLGGRRAFEGETISDTLASVLKTDVDLSTLPADMPLRVQALLRRCLERNPKQRLRDIGEARIVLEDVLTGRGDEPAAGAATAAAPVRRLPLAPVVAGALVLGVAATLLATQLNRPRVEVPLRKFHLTTPRLEGARPTSPVISPDGRRVAYLQPGRLNIQSLADLEPKSFSVPAGASRLFWSPDGRSVGYIAGATIFKVEVSGTEPQEVCDTRGTPSSGGWGAWWREDGTIVFSRGDSAGILVVPAGGGDPKPLVPVDSTESDLHEPSELPGGRGLIFPSHGHRSGISQLWLFADGKRRKLLELPGQTIADPVYSPTGHILFRRSPTTPGIWAAPFSLSKLEITGEPFIVVPDGSLPSVARDGTLAYLGGSAASATQLVWTDAAGREVGTLGPVEEDGSEEFALSPDGRRAVRRVTVNDNRDLFIYDADRGTRTRLTFDPSSDDWPGWSPDGRRIVYSIQPKGMSGASSYFIGVRAADGTGAVDTLGPGVVPDFTPDGRHVTYVALLEGGARWDLMEVPIEGPRTPRLLVAGNPQVIHGVVSPGSDLMAYMSRESGKWEVFLTRYPACEGKWQISTAGGQYPRWSAKGDRLWFVQGDDVMEVTVAHGASPVLGTPRRIFTRPAVGTFGFELAATFAVSPDGSRFLTPHPTEQKGEGPRVTLVQNWFAEFAAKAKAAK